MKVFEVSSRKSKNGRRKFKLIMHEIYPDTCIDAKEEIGTIYNENGITWIKEYVEKNLHTVKDTSLKVEFADEEKTEILGHGETGIQDGLPLFENAEIVGHFTNAYITDIEEDGVTKTVLIGEGYLDEMCHPVFVQKLVEDTANGEAPFGSVEILKCEYADGIIYKYGYKESGRIPTDYIYSGYALLGVRPADKTAKLLEINNRLNKEENPMDEKQIKALVEEVIREVLDSTSEIEKCREAFEAQIADAKQEVAAKDALIEELNARIAEIQRELETCQSEKDALVSEKESMQGEVDALKDEVVEAQKKEKHTELNAAIASFSDEEKEYAKAEMEAFNKDPMAVEINSVVNAILVGIGLKAKKDAAIVAEQNASKADIEDIFAEVSGDTFVEDDSIF